MSLRDKYTDEEWTQLEEKLSLNPTNIKTTIITPGKYKRVIIQSDSYVHDYVIPYELNNEFLRLLDYCYMRDDYEEFEDKFDIYRCKGDVFSEYEFYIKEK